MKLALVLRGRNTVVAECGVGAGETRGKEWGSTPGAFRQWLPAKTSENTETKATSSENEKTCLLQQRKEKIISCAPGD